MLERSPPPDRRAAPRARRPASLARAALVAIGCATATCAAGPWSDPFGAPPRGTSPNCGPELRKKYDIAIRSRDDFAAFLRENPIDDQVRLDNFAEKGKVDWARVAAAVTTSRIGNRMVYSLDFNPEHCSGFTLRMTDQGHVSLYGCCGM